MTWSPRPRAAEADAAEEVLLTAIQECSCEAWKLSKYRIVAGAVPDHVVTVRALEDRMGWRTRRLRRPRGCGDRPGPRRHGRALRACGEIDGRAHRVGAQRVEVTLTRDGAIVGSPAGRRSPTR